MLATKGNEWDQVICWDWRHLFFWTITLGVWVTSRTPACKQTLWKPALWEQRAVSFSGFASGCASVLTARVGGSTEHYSGLFMWLSSPPGSKPPKVGTVFFPMITVEEKGSHANLTHSGKACVGALETQRLTVTTEYGLKLKPRSLTVVYG